MDIAGTVVVPGDRIGSATTYSSGHGTHIKGPFIYSTLVGKIDIAPGSDDQLPLVQVKTQKDATSVVPVVGDIVTAKVTKINPKMANVNILCVGSTALIESYSGVIRREDVRLTEVDKVDVFKCFRPGDVVRAEVASLGDSRSYLLSTARNELGVIFAQSRVSGATMMPVSWEEMVCPQTGQKEYRKVAKVE